MTEDEFFGELLSRLPGSDGSVVVPPGDDCAAVETFGDRLLLLAVDQLVGDRHYIMGGAEATLPRLAGRKLLARNLSDIAAMGGTPKYCLLAAAFGPACSDDWIHEFYEGIIGLAGEYGVDMIGGDLSRTPNDSVSSLTIIGEVDRHRVCRRSGAGAGDQILVTGAFGDAFSTGHHLMFKPRCAEGRWLAETGAVRAMIDVSDGLGIDTCRMCRASGVGVLLDADQIPLRHADVSPVRALSDGEDYELVFAVEATRVSRLLHDWPFPETGLTVIGETVEKKDILMTADGMSLEGMGYDHFDTV